MISKPDTCKSCPLYELPYGKKTGYVPADGSGDNGVLIILEAAGEDEEKCGIPVVGKAGQYLFQQLKRVGIEREGFRIHNVLSCRPPDNKLVKMPYTKDAIEHCAPNLNKTIADHVEHCKETHKTPVILTLGKFSTRRILGLEDKDAIMRNDYGSYPHWSEEYKCWVVCCPHPSHVMQGNHHLAHLIHFCAQRAINIASNGLEIEEPPYLLDPKSRDFFFWVDEFIAEQKKNPQDTFLSYDIETPYKKGKSEEDIVKEESDDYTILRCSFCWKAGNAVSVPWIAEYLPGIERLFTSGGFGLNWNGELYDNPRIIHYIPTFNLISLDGMLAWHVLHTSMPKGLGFVTPFFWQNCSMWKHLSDVKPAYYNAKDADAALRNWLGTKNLLLENDLYPVFEAHVMKINEVLRYMTGKGVSLDKEARKRAEVKLSSILASLKQEMDDAVPESARRSKAYKRTPKNTEGLIQVDGTVKTKQCPICKAPDVKASHFKPTKKTKIKLGEPENPCIGQKGVVIEVPAKLWAMPLEFKLSLVGLKNYQKAVGHKPIIDRKTKSITFDEKAVKRLQKKYPSDPLYPIIIKFRESQTLLTRYVGVTMTKEIEVPDDYILRQEERFVVEKDTQALR